MSNERSTPTMNSLLRGWRTRRGAGQNPPLSRAMREQREARDAAEAAAAREREGRHDE